MQLEAYKKINMKKIAMRYSRCDSLSVVKNGSISNGKKKFLCKECLRLFVENSERRKNSDAEWRMFDRLIPEKISIAGTERSVSISKIWLQKYIKKNWMKLEDRLSACRRHGKT